MALGRIDYHLYRPWRPLERILYGSMAEFLAAWEDGRAAAVRRVPDRRASRTRRRRTGSVTC